MPWKTAALVAAMAAWAALSFGAPVSAATTLAANPSSDLYRRPPETAPIDWTFTPAAAGYIVFFGTGAGYGPLAPPKSANFSADLFEGALSQALSAPPSQTPASSFGLPVVWTLLILGVALIGFAARRARRPARQYNRYFSLYTHFTRHD